MSKIDDLIAQYCPDGVEWKPIGEVTKVLRGRRLTKSQLSDNEKYPVYHGGLEPLGNYKEYNRGANSVMIINVGASAGTVGYSFIDFWSSDGCYCLDNNEGFNSRFFYHFLLTKEESLRSKVRRAGIPTLDAMVIERTLVPIPPLLVQEAIVEILDKFTALEAELEAELEARTRQYEYYRNELLSFESKDVEWKALGEVADVTKLAGYEFTEHIKYSNKGKIIALRALNIKKGKLELANVKYIDDSNFEKLSRSKLWINDMLFTYVGTIGEVALIDEQDKYYLAPNVARIRFKYSEINPKLMQYYFQSDDFFRNQIGRYLSTSSMKNLTMTNIRKFLIPVPPIEEQNRIVDILDKFDALVNDISTGLPAEIKARKQQYEYYRGKLLSFEPKSA